MLELGQLESHHEAFAERNARVVVISMEEEEDAALTQKQFPHLVVVADAEGRMAEALAVAHPDSNPYGGDTTAPTTIVTDGRGAVRWVYRPARYLERLSPEEVLAALDEHVLSSR
jgi:peroxiredoxin